MLFKVIFAIFTSIQIISADEQPKIIIVGAGLSGLSAAVKLIKNGYDNIIIMEAENRIGGRIHSVKLSDAGFVDLGGQWVHGMGNNSVYEDVHEKYNFGVTGFDDYFPHFLQSDGTPLDQNQCQEFAEIATNILFSSCAEMIHVPLSIQEYFDYKMTNEVRQKKLDFSMMKKFTDYYEKEMNIWNGSATWKDLSAPFNCISGYNSGTLHLTWKRDGYQKFIELLTNQTNVLDKVILNKEVVNVQWNPRYENKKVIVTTADGHKYFTDHVIFTASLGVLKDRYRTLFSPQLPLDLRNAIDAMGYGNIGKIFLEFEKPFWPIKSDWVGYGLLWTEEDKRKLTGTSKEWLLDIQTFSKLDAFPNVLEALLAGPSMKVFETLSDEEIIEDSMMLLEKFLLKRLPRPKTMLRTKWLTNRNFLGSYSYYSVDACTYNVRTKDLAQNLYNLRMKPEVLFAGEHTDELYSSNAHGAVNSGRRAANDLLEYYNSIYL